MFLFWLTRPCFGAPNLGTPKHEVYGKDGARNILNAHLINSRKSRNEIEKLKFNLRLNSIKKVIILNLTFAPKSRSEALHLNIAIYHYIYFQRKNRDPGT